MSPYQHLVNNYRWFENASNHIVFEFDGVETLSQDGVAYPLLLVDEEFVPGQIRIRYDRQNKLWVCHSTLAFRSFYAHNPYDALEQYYFYLQFETDGEPYNE